MAEQSTGMLTVDDLRHVIGAVYPARTKWYNIGLQLDVPVDTLDSIERERGDDGDHLRNMLKWWLKQGAATWRALADALKNPIIGEHQLSKKLDIRARGQMIKLQPDSIESTSILSMTCTGIPDCEAVVNTRSRIEQLEKSYCTLVTTTQEVVRRKAPSIEEFRTAITLLPSSVKHQQQQYLRDHLKYIYEAESIDQIFGHLNLQVWNYLNFGLLECIVAKYGDPTTEKEMLEYKASVQSFRKNTPLHIFLEAQPKGKYPEISPSLKKHLQEVRFRYRHLVDKSSLEDVECIRLDVACELALPDFAVAMTRIEFGSVSIVWTIPSSLTAILKDKIEKESFQFIQWADVVEVAISGTRIYPSSSATVDPIGLIDDAQVMSEGGSLPFECFEPYEHDNAKVDLSFGSIKPLSKTKQTSIQKYDMEQFPHGLCLIINNKEFAKNIFMRGLISKPREGAEVDERNLISTFRFLGYKVEVYRNCKASKMKDVFERMQKLDHTNYDSFVCCILTYGIAEEMYLYGSDNKELHIGAMTSMLNEENCKTLAGKPKLFFFQACIGKEGVDDSGIEEESEIPNEADFFFSYATPSDTVAWRDLHHGSWYISELCRSLCTHATCRDLNSMIEEAHEIVGPKYMYKPVSYKQAPEFTTRLRKDVYFF